MSDDQLYRRPSDTDSQVGDPASDAGKRQMEDQSAERSAAPAAPATILMEALLAITQALKPSSTGPWSEIRSPNFNGEGSLMQLEAI